MEQYHCDTASSSGLLIRTGAIAAGYDSGFFSGFYGTPLFPFQPLEAP
jgi:hypothetical protein